MQPNLDSYKLAGLVSIIAWVFYAFALEPGRKLKQRLTDPSPIDEGTENLVKA